MFMDDIDDRCETFMESADQEMVQVNKDVAELHDDLAQMVTDTRDTLDKFQPVAYAEETKKELDEKITKLNDDLSKFIEEKRENVGESIEIKRLEEDIQRLKVELESVAKQPVGKDNQRERNSHSGEDQYNHQGKDVDMLFCMDSNAKYINFRKLWTVKNSVRHKCYTQHQLTQFINNMDMNTLKCILIHVGVNDIDRANGEEVFENLRDNVMLLSSKYDGIKIIISELTPRTDERDEEVNTCNILINELASSSDNIFVANHQELRDNKEMFIVDERHHKHIAQNKIGRFVVNLKKALCEAHGTTYQGKAAYGNSGALSRPTPNRNKRDSDPHNSESSILKSKLIQVFTQTINTVFGN